MRKFVHEFGTCPECGSLNLDYGNITWNDTNIDPSIQQEITCVDCGCNFNEIYNVKPDTVDIIWHGNKDVGEKIELIRRT